MLDFYDHALAVILIAALPPRAWLTFRSLARAAPAERPKLRRRLYTVAMITQWALASFVILRWLRAGRAWTELGLIPVITSGAIGIGAGLIVIAILIALQSRGGDRETLERARARLEHVEPLLPHTPSELRHFRLVAVTAGICEELLFRGFLIWYFAHFTGLIQAALLSSLSFGIGHAYQGLRFIVITAFLGAFMSAVYLISGSLLLPMLIHALMDLYSSWVGYRLFGPAGESAIATSPPESVA